MSLPVYVRLRHGRHHLPKWRVHAQCARRICRQIRSSVNLSFCLNASGKHVPNTIGINVELQLDSMKQRGAVKRMLFLKSGLPHLTQSVLLHNGGQEQCSEMKIYLKGERRENAADSDERKGRWITRSSCADKRTLRVY
ncbi:unnamed protein product [Ranitomeya imitator]|uniref:Integrin alpha first immunoglubulin-like domain-containing protein n=1 Tax=Ranitomeya imitator TaxID=111125 RepID=A0ABN9M556_9NEOB|nr:unnamed protein product [Ranitomeya imitator]